VINEATLIELVKTGFIKGSWLTTHMDWISKIIELTGLSLVFARSGFMSWLLRNTLIRL